MSPKSQLVADGSSPEDSHETVEIDRSDPVDRYRYTCPNGHISWDKTNNHIWCHSCRKQLEAGDEVEPEHWKVYDKSSGEFVPWTAVKVVWEEEREVPEEPPSAP